MPTLRNILRRAKRAGRELAGRDPRTRVQTRVATEYLGSDYGGFVVHPDPLTADSVVYSFGIGDDVSFDLAIIERFGARVHGFDPTPRSADWVASQDLPERFVFQRLGLAHYDGAASFTPPENEAHVSFSIAEGTGSGAVELPVRRLSTIMTDLGHDRVDLLKMDIEGAEYEVFEQLAAERPPVRQIAVEFHHRLPGVGREKTERAIQVLNGAGYRVFCISPNGEEYSLVRTGS